MDFTLNVLASTVGSAAPLLLAAMGGIVAHQVGKLNIGIEGMMLLGAFGAVVTAHLSGSAGVGLVGAMAAGALLGLVFGLFTIHFKANIIIVGLGSIMLASGVAGYALPVAFGVWGAFRPPDLPVLSAIRLPLIHDVPLLGRVLSGHSILVYLSYLSIWATAVLLYRTVWGVRARATGEDEEAARSAGVPTIRIQYQALVVCGALAALAGAQLAIGELALFHKEMIGGRGFIALAAFYFGAFRPGRTGVACVLFGVFEALQFRLQHLGIPPQLIQMVPYLSVVLALIGIQVQRVWGARRARVLAK
jgi:general nucleoside transport system permease protein